MIIRAVVEKFISEKTDLIDHGDWDAVYNVFYTEYAEEEKDIGNLTDALIAAGINPLEGKKSVHTYMFYESEQTEVIIPDSVFEICAEAFTKTSDMRKIYIPKSVKKFAFRCFKNVGLWPMAVQITYEGTRNEWLEIYKERGWDYETIMNVKCLGDKK